MAKQLKASDKIVWIDAKVSPNILSKGKPVQVTSKELLIFDKKRGIVCGFFVMHLQDRNGPFERVKAGESLFIDIDGTVLQQPVKYCELSSLVV